MCFLHKRSINTTLRHLSFRLSYESNYFKRMLHLTAKIVQVKTTHVNLDLCQQTTFTILRHTNKISTDHQTESI